MFQLVLSKRFKKNLFNFLKKHPELRSVFQEKTSLLQENPKNPSLRTHKLTGKLEGYFASWITYEYRIVFTIEKDSIFLLAIGTHEEVY